MNEDILLRSDILQQVSNTPITQFEIYRVLNNRNWLAQTAIYVLQVSNLELASYLPMRATLFRNMSNFNIIPMNMCNFNITPEHVKLQHYTNEKDDKNRFQLPRPVTTSLRVRLLWWIHRAMHHPTRCFGFLEEDCSSPTPDGGASACDIPTDIVPESA